MIFLLDELVVNAQNFSSTEHAKIDFCFVVRDDRFSKLLRIEIIFNRQLDISVSTTHDLFKCLR